MTDETFKLCARAAILLKIMRDNLYTNDMSGDDIPDDVLEEVDEVITALGGELNGCER